MTETGYAGPTATRRWTGFRLRQRFNDLRCRVYDTLLDWVLRNHPHVRDSNIVSYAEDELRRAGWADEDAFYGDLMLKAVMRQARLFAIEGHSGMSAGIAMNLAKEVCMFKPLTPLTGDDDEWTLLDYGDGTKWQNKRASHVFKDADGNAYDIEGRIFREPSGACFTGKDSRVPVTFPYTPKREYVDVAGDDV